MPFWPFKNSDNKIAVKETKIEVSSNQYFSQFQALKQQFQDFIQNNLPMGFEHKFNKTKPYIFASFVAWPLFWFYRGLEWSTHRQNARLSMYIQKTYLQAKFMQVSIIMFGLTVASLIDYNEKEITEISYNEKRR